MADIPVSFKQWVVSKLNSIEDTILLQGGISMAQYNDVKSLISAVNDRTNEIGADVGAAATRVAAIQQQLADLIAQGATPAQLQEAVTQLTAVHDGLASADTALKGIAADPANPIPS
jgi:outer membrane murein-binding lipoprotein Lpp